MGPAAHLTQAQALRAGAAADVAFEGFFHGHDLFISSIQTSFVLSVVYRLKAKAFYRDRQLNCYIHRSTLQIEDRYDK